MDYNTTPPCGMIRAYAKDNRPLDVRGFYLFVCLGPDANRTGGYRLSGLALCDGNLLNEDFSYYLSIVGERTKRVGLGTYGDGADRSRPMVIFANPLGTAELGCTVTLVHSRTDLDTEFTEIRQVGRIGRTDTLGRIHTFTCYRHRKDVADSQIIFDLLDPFPAPIRTERTQSRGRFKINVAPGD